MSDTHTSMQTALEALQNSDFDLDKRQAACAALIKALSMPTQTQPVIAPSLPIVREAVAQAIYEQWVYLASFKPWQAGGNSQMQDKARAIANAAFDATPQPVIAPEWVMLTNKELDKVVFDCGLCRTSQDIAKAIQAAFIKKQCGAA